MKYEVFWSNSAKFDLESIIEYIKIDSIEIAKKIFFEIKEKCDELNEFPLKYRIVPELQEIGVCKYREIIYKRWRIIYKVEKLKVYILIVVDSRRNLEDILFQRVINEN